MKILDILSEERILADLSARSKDEMLAELSTLLASSVPDVSAERLLEVLVEREKLGSTAIGEGIAIPHGKLSPLRKVVAAFGRSREGIDCDSVDGQPTKLFFLLVAPEDSSGVHLKALARVSRLLRNGEFRERLLAGGDRREIFEAIRDEDQKH